MLIDFDWNLICFVYVFDLYVSVLFGFFLRIGLTILILLAFRVAYPMDLVILPISVIILFIGMLAIESFTLLKKDRDLDWIETE